MVSYKTFCLLISCVLLAGFAHGCGHDDLEFNPQFLDIGEDMSFAHQGRLLQSVEYPNIRMYVDYSNLDSASRSYKAYIQNDLAPPVIDYFQAALKVKYPVKGTFRLSPSIRTLCDLDTPEILHTGVEADFVLLFDSKEEDSATVASSIYCQLSASSNRPLVASTVFNRNMLVEPKGDILLHEKNMYLLIHEIMHALGFSRNTYEYFIDENGNTRKGHIKTRTANGKQNTVIDVPPLTDRLRKFYGCPSLEGAYMENEGGSGTAMSHFERKLFVYETMSSGGIYGRRVSEFSLALLEGSGWYIPDYSYAEPYFFGQGQGCAFVTGSCANRNYNFDEFCNGHERGCAPQGRAGGRCTSDPKADGCSYIFPEVDYDCDNPDGYDNARLPDLQVFGRGAGSKCFTGDLNTRQSRDGRTSFCFKYSCDNNELKVHVGDNAIVCKQAGKMEIDGYYGSVDCPDPREFCGTVGKAYCPRNCLGRGTCVNNRCECNKGFTGIDCGLNGLWE